jgi:ferredoxin
MSDNIISRKFLSLDALPLWLAALSQSATVYVPQREGKGVVYRPFQEGGAMELRERPTESAKHTIFPRSEPLFNFTRKGEAADPNNRSLSLEPAPEPGPAVVFGAPSCDVRGFFAFDPVYDGSGTQGKFRDVYYLKRRGLTTLIARACRSMLRTCFCHWVGGGPTSVQGADAQATDVDGGFVLEAYTELGKAALETGGLPDASKEQVAQAKAARDAVDKSVAQAPDISKAPESLMKLFDDGEFWLSQSFGGCISCRACTFLCPTCYCFNITDEGNGISGTRLRNWDSCMTFHFTREASGHNPRVNRSHRLKNRVGHKFSYYPMLHDGRISCCGCGRCIKNCPSSVDIRAIVLNAIKEAGNV